MFRTLFTRISCSRCSSYADSSMLQKCPTNLKFISSIMKLQQTNGSPSLKPALHLCADELGVRFAGHSKWQNIRHTKAAKDRAKSILFSRIIRDVEKVAAKGLDPKVNLELAKILMTAQSSNVPSSTIQKALARVEFRKKNPVATYLAYKGPRGVLVVVTTITDDIRRTRADMNKIAKKYNFVVFKGDPTSSFIPKGWIFAKPPENVTNVADRSVEDAIEVGAEEVEPDEENPEILKFICECPELAKVKSKLEGRNYAIEEAYAQYIPRAPIELSEEELESLGTLFEEIEELTEVEKVFANVA